MAGAAANGVKQEPGEENAMQQNGNGSKLTAAQRKKLKKKEREKAKKAAKASRYALACLYGRGTDDSSSMQKTWALQTMQRHATQP